MLSHPLFLAGFRPFFLLALVAGFVYPILWALSFAGAMPLPSGGMEPMAWHAHEMFYGFGWAVLGGFLLTSSKNWVKIRGLHGGPLALAAALWCLERVAILFWGGFARNWQEASTAQGIGFLVLFNVFPIYMIAYLVWSLVRYHKQDFYPDNWIFVVALPVFVVAKSMMLVPTTMAVGEAMTVGLFRVAFVVMFERTITQFMKNGNNIDLLSNPWLDYGIKVLVLVAVFQLVLPLKLAVFVLWAAAALLFVRWLLWKPLVAFKRFSIGVMYVGYMGLVVHLAFAALDLSGTWKAIGTISLHVFTFICMGLIIPSMIIRIAQGHTGRKPLFFTSDKIALWLMGAGAFSRLVLSQVWPAHYSLWISVAAVGWSACFLIVALRVAPFMWHARIDGKVH